MHAKSKVFWLSILMITCLLGGMIIGNSKVAQAVHDEDLFQLDYVTSPVEQGVANVSSTNISPAGNDGDDWDMVYNGTDNAFAKTFITDTVSTAETSFYTGGGSKDERPISTGNQHWEWNNTNDVIPDKDDLSHAFAAAYTATNGHVIFYFGADRYDTSGDAEVGFWFFRQPVKLDAKPNFAGEHEVGDILVLANWGGSNKVGDIAVYKWVGGNRPLELLRDTTQADCSAASADDPVCAVVNNLAGETPPWDYTNKDGENSYQASALFEGGIDMTALIGPELGCYSSFLAATRSSHSTDAQLKDFALGAFPVCQIAVDKTGDALSKVGDPAAYTITISNPGKVTLYKKSITDTLLGIIAKDGVNENPNGYVLSNTCEKSLAPGAACTITLERIVQAGDPDPLPNTVNILYTETATFAGLQLTASDDHSVNLFQPAVKIDKTGDGLSKVTDAVNYTFTITNMSSQDSPDLALASISDNIIGDLSADALAAGCDTLVFEEQCAFSIQRTVAEDDLDPLVNTVEVLYHPIGFPNDITASDGHSVNLFQPSVSITKTGDALSKIGDNVTYHVAIANTSSADSPALVLDSISDDVLGDLSIYAGDCASLLPGGTCEFDVPWTVAVVDLQPADGIADDPIINTVTIHFHPDGFPNDISATASHELNLFQPSIAFSKTADTSLSKVTDTVNYTLALNNTSSVDAPDLVCTITDAMLGVNKTVTLASNKGDVTEVAYTVQAGDPDPLDNTADVTCSPVGFPNVLTASGSWTVNLFQPGVTIEKRGNALSKVGDDVTYTFTITNTSSDDSPNLLLASIADDVLGDLKPKADAEECDVLTYKESCTFDVPWTVEAVDLNPADGMADDPIINTVDVLYHPAGFENDIRASASHELNLFQPDMTFSKTVNNTLSKATDDVLYTLTLNNNSSEDSPDLICAITDPLLELNNLPVTLAAGATWTQTYTYTVQADDPDPLVNTASVTCSPQGFPNVLEASGSASVNLFQPSFTLEKIADTERSKVGDLINYTVILTNTSSDDAPPLDCTITDSLMGDLPDVFMASGETRSITYGYTVQPGDPDPLVNTATAKCSPQGFPNVLTASSGKTVNLFQPRVSIKKTGDTLSKIGDDVTYTFTITNTSSADSPDLILDSLSDTQLGDLMDVAPSECSELAPGASCTFDVTWTVPPDAADPTINTVTVHFHPAGFPNDITDTDSHELNLFQPSLTFDKRADTELSKVTDTVNYTLTLNNTSSADAPDLQCTITDDMLDVNKTVRLASGKGDVTNIAYIVQAGDPDPLVNTADVTCSPIGFPNILTASDSWSVNLFQPSIAFLKEADTELSKVTDTVNYTITLTNTSSDDTPALVCTITDSLLSIDEDVTLASGEFKKIEKAYVVPADAPDPLVNTANATCSPTGFPNVLTATSGWTVELFQPSVNIEKTGDALSKIGDAVTYTFTITNTSSADSPNLVLASITDTVLGDLKLAAEAENCGTLSPGASCDFTVDWTVPEGAADPTINKVNVLYHPAGFPNDITDTASHTLNLFQPSLTFDKRADTQLSKVGDVVNYTLTLNNTSSADAPNLECAVTDALLGVDEELTLVSGASWSHTYPFTVPVGAKDPLPNEASVSCSPTGFPNVLTDTDDWTVNLFQPSITLIKSGPGYSKAGDTAVYTVTITNTSSSDTPDLHMTSFNDSLVPGATPAAECDVLAVGESCTFSYSYTVIASDADPLVNTATAHYKPLGFPNDITNTASWTTDLLHPQFTATKACKAEPVPQAGPAVFTITFNNTGDADLHVVPSEGAAFDVAAGGSYSYEVSIAGPFTDTVPNTVTGTVTLAARYGLSNSYTFSASDSCTVYGKARVIKTVSGGPVPTDVFFTFELREGASSYSEGTVLETKPTTGLGEIDFVTNLVPGQTYQLCEWVFPGWSTNLLGDSALFVPNSLIPPALPNPTVNNLTVCTNFSVASGKLRSFTVDNTPPPGGRALTIGFWKNWASCSASNGKGQQPMLDQTLAQAIVIGDLTDGHSTLPGIVMSATSGSYAKFGPTYSLVLHGAPSANAPDCLKAVRLLNKSTIDTGKKQASDPAFNLAAQLVAAQLNFVAGAYQNGQVITAVNQSVLILGKYKFNGITHTKISAADVTAMNNLAKILDDYNNNR